MWKSVLIFSMVLALCYCDKGHQLYHKKKHHHHHHDYFYHHLLYKGIFTYLAFWAIKIKVIFVLGAVFTMLMFGGKLFALMKYADIKHEHHEPEKIYIQAHDHHDHGGSFDYLPPHGNMEGFSNSFPGNQGVVLDHPPAGAEFSTPSRFGYQRSYETGGFFEKFKSFARLIETLNISDLAFNSMDIKDDECRKKFVCEQEYYSKKSEILRTLADYLTDDNYKRYQTNATINSEEECAILYSNCISKNATTPNAT